jgi:hypothetical protein
MTPSWTGGAEALETPIPLVDLDRLERNLDRMARYASGHGLLCGRISRPTSHPGLRWSSCTAVPWASPAQRFWKPK